MVDEEEVSYGRPTATRKTRNGEEQPRAGPAVARGGRFSHILHLFFPNFLLFCSLFSVGDCLWPDRKMQPLLQQTPYLVLLGFEIANQHATFNLNGLKFADFLSSFSYVFIYNR